VVEPAGIKEMLVTDSSRQQAVRKGKQEAAVTEQASVFVSHLRFMLPTAQLTKDRTRTEAALAEKPLPENAPVERQQQQDQGKEKIEKNSEQTQLPSARPQPVSERGFVSLKLAQDQWLPQHKLEVDRSTFPLEGKTQTQTVQQSRAFAVTTIQARNISELLQGLSGRIRVMSQQGIQRARLQLDPPELGRIALELESKGSHLRVHVVTERVQVQEQLQLWLEQLKENLKLAGVDFEHVEVEVQTQAQSDDADFSSWLQTPVTMDDDSQELIANQEVIERSFGYNTFEMQG
jgi:flagellar hook-length control protein FliK